MGGYGLLQGIFPTQGSNPGLLHRQAESLLLSHREVARMLLLPNISPQCSRCDLGKQAP